MSTLTSVGKFPSNKEVDRPGVNQPQPLCGDWTRETGEVAAAAVAGTDDAR